MSTASTAVHASVELGGYDAHLQRAGAGEPLLAIAGPWLGGSWLELHTELGRSFDVIVPQGPGFGATPLPEQFSDFTDLVLHYAALLDALELSRVHLVGHGFGGWVAAEIAAFFPERVQTLTLLAPWGLRPEAEEPMVNLFRTTDDEELALMLGGDLERWRDTLVVADPAQQLVRGFQERTAVARVAWNPRYDLKLEQRLWRLTAPALVLVPEHDGVVAPSVARRYADALPAGRLETIGGTTVPTEHLFVLQEPAAVARRIAALAPMPEIA